MLLSKQNEKYVDRFLDHFFGTFLKKVEIHIFHPSRFALVPCAVYLVKLTLSNIGQFVPQADEG